MSRNATSTARAAPFPPHDLPRILDRSDGLNTSEFPPAATTTVEKDWHTEVSMELRQHLIGKLVMNLFPSPGPDNLTDERIREVIPQAMEMEKELFDDAKDRLNYYTLVEQKILSIHQERVARELEVFFEN